MCNPNCISLLETDKSCRKCLLNYRRDLGVLHLLLKAFRFFPRQPLNPITAKTCIHHSRRFSSNTPGQRGVISLKMGCRRVAGRSLYLATPDQAIARPDRQTCTMNSVLCQKRLRFGLQRWKSGIATLEQNLPM